MLKKSLILAASLTCAASLSGCNEIKMQSANLKVPVYNGENQKTVVAKLGQPVDVQVYKNNTVLVFCDETFIFNNLLHVWFRDGRVLQTKKSSNDEIGSCLNRNSQVNWAATISLDSLVLGNPEAQGSLSSGMADALEKSIEQNNQISNTLLENMGKQIESIGNSNNRMSTECRWYGNVLRCN
jgi:hypothetical protein